MVWFITGSKKSLVMGMSDSGNPICHGQGSHDPRPPGLNDFGDNIDRPLFKRIQSAECAWTVAASTESERNLDPMGEGLFEAVARTPQDLHGKVHFYAGEPDLVGFTLVVPGSTFGNVQRLFEPVLLSEKISYSMTVDFPGFRMPHANVNTPTWQEFIECRPLFFEHFSLSVREAESDA